MCSCGGQKRTSSCDIAQPIAQHCSTAAQRNLHTEATNDGCVVVWLCSCAPYLDFGFIAAALQPHRCCLELCNFVGAIDHSNAAKEFSATQKILQHKAASPIRNTARQPLNAAAQSGHQDRAQGMVSRSQPHRHCVCTEHTPHNQTS